MNIGLIALAVMIIALEFMKKNINPTKTELAAWYYLVLTIIQWVAIGYIVYTVFTA